MFWFFIPAIGFWSVENKMIPSGDDGELHPKCFCGKCSCKFSLSLVYSTQQVAGVHKNWNIQLLEYTIPPPPLHGSLVPWISLDLGLFEACWFWKVQNMSMNWDTITADQSVLFYSHKSWFQILYLVNSGWNRKVTFSSIPCHKTSLINICELSKNTL